MEIELFNGVDTLTEREFELQNRLEERVRKRRNESLIISQVRRYPPAFEWEFVVQRRQLWRRSNTAEDRARLWKLFRAFLSDRRYGRGTSVARLQLAIRDWRIFHAVAGAHLVSRWPLKRCWAEAADRVDLSQEAVRKIWQVWQQRCRQFRSKHLAALDTKCRYVRLLRKLNLISAKKWETTYRGNDLFMPGIGWTRYENVSSDASEHSRRSLTECIRYFIRKREVHIKEFDRPLVFSSDVTVYLGWCRCQLRCIRIMSILHGVQAINREAELKGEPVTASLVKMVEKEMSDLVPDF